jgi:hypothetical protein
MTLGKEVTFAECLPSSTQQRINLCRVPPGTLGKEPAREGPHVRFFVECYVRHSAKRDSLPSVRDITLGKEPIPVPRSWFFAECYGLDTRQEPAREGPHVRFFAECYVRHSAKRDSLPSVRDIILGKETIPVPRSWFFAECYGLDTRQRTSLPSVTLGKVTRMHLFLFFVFHPHKQKISHIYHIYTLQMSSQI